MERFLDIETMNAPNPLSPDDYAQRQFLYPTALVPEPATAVLWVVGLLAMCARLRAATSSTRKRATLANKPPFENLGNLPVSWVFNSIDTHL